MTAWRTIAALLLLTGCAVAPEWVRPGADASATANEYRDCRALAADAVKPQVDIDQDILATRQNPWQHVYGGRVEGTAPQEETRRRAAALVASCMQAKGFVRAR